MSTHHHGASGQPRRSTVDVPAPLHREPIGSLRTEERRMEPWESAAIRYRFKIDHARRVERVLQWLGWTVGCWQRQVWSGS